MSEEIGCIISDITTGSYNFHSSLKNLVKLY